MPIVVLVVLDGVRHQEIFEGAGFVGGAELMPNLHRLARTRGLLLGGPEASDAMWASGPSFVSLPGYREILTGRPSFDCQSNECGPLGVDTLADEFRDRAASPHDVAVISSWEGIANAASRKPESMVISCGRIDGYHREALASDAVAAALLREGDEAAPAPGTDKFRPDALTAQIALGYLARERPRFLFLGLGESDEYGHRNDFAGYLGSLRAADRTIGEIDRLFEATGEWERDALLVVTTDHGRGHDIRVHGGDVPESGRVWMMAAGRRVGRSGFTTFSRVGHLADIAPAVRALEGLAGASPSATPILTLLGAQATRQDEKAFR